MSEQTAEPRLPIPYCLSPATLRLFPTTLTAVGGRNVPEYLLDMSAASGP
jgi:hypothetical protein